MSSDMMRVYYGLGRTDCEMGIKDMLFYKKIEAYRKGWNFSKHLQDVAMQEKLGLITYVD